MGSRMAVCKTVPVLLFCLVKNTLPYHEQLLDFSRFPNLEPKRLLHPVSYTHLTLPTICSV
eukprot:2954690-Prorocentrum_lima.AAC.1